MRDDESVERFLTQHPPVTPPAPAGELQLLQARIGEPASAPAHPARSHAVPRPASRVPRSLLAHSRTRMAAVVLSLALALTVVLTRHPKPEHAAPQNADIEAVMSDTYGTLDDVADDDGSGLTWFDSSAAVE